MFDYTSAELEEVKAKYFSSLIPLVLSDFPSKEKKKFLCLIPIIESFDQKKVYLEKEVNEILKSIYAFDYCILRRYLIDYGFLDREESGKSYWVREDK